ncbi:MAG: 23S rRNA (adenine(2503)-C(2))-methyltransferase RlmN [Treponema sp.]|nr:23S rRNA (adenine(2503)-C(2))-methyltransferase RlmN [Treponema sp.]
MTIPELTAALENLPEGEKLPPYRGKQIFSWIKRGALSFEEMTNLPRGLIKTLANHAVIRGSKVRKKLTGRDGTEKLVLELADGTAVETVLLETEPGRFTACLSSQAGCPLGCVFCKTGALGFFRNLDPSEIVEQFLFLSGTAAEKTAVSQKDFRISNIVVMGMGEPLLNLQSLRKALAILCDPAGFGFSKRRITVSTSGICAGILDMIENGPEVELAVSIASAQDDLRRRLMPGSAGNPLPRLKETLTQYQKKTGRQITIETVLLGGINTRPEDARALIDFTGNLNTTVNLIPWNPVKELCFEGKKLCRCEEKETAHFIRMLEQGGITVTRRYRRGHGISGACGQLGGSSLS